jgi:hypothetical protein
MRRRLVGTVFADADKALFHCYSGSVPAVSSTLVAVGEHGPITTQELRWYGSYLLRLRK